MYGVLKPAMISTGRGPDVLHLEFLTTSDYYWLYVYGVRVVAGEFRRQAQSW